LGHVPSAKAPGLASAATPLGPGALLRFQKPCRCFRPHRRTTRPHEKPGHSGPPAGVRPHKAGLGSTCPRRPGDSLPFALSLRKQTQEGCAFPVQPRSPSQASRSPCRRPRARCLGLGCVRLVVPRHAVGRQTGSWAKAPKGLALPPTAEASGLPRLNAHHRDGSPRSTPLYARRIGRAETTVRQCAL
jgi:hypothetical protein